MENESDNDYEAECCSCGAVFDGDDAEDGECPYCGSDNLEFHEV